MRRPLSTALALVAGAVLLQACSASQPMREEAWGPPPSSVASAPVYTPAGQQDPRQVHGTATPGRTDPGRADPARDGGFSPAAATLVAAPRAAVAGAPLRSPRAARDLAGLTDGQLVSVMGEPDLKRNEEAAQAWLYRSPLCLLDVFLEADGPNAEPRVVLAAARPVGDVQLAEEACLRGLARTRAGLRPPFQP